MKRKMKWIGHMQSWKGIVKGYHMRLKGRRTETFQVLEKEFEYNR